MSIDLMGLNSLLSIAQPKSNLDALKEYRNGLWKKLSQGANTTDKKPGGPGKDDSGNQADIKRAFAELEAVDKQIQQASYEEQSRKLEEENLKREEAAAKKLREREKALAKHERVLENASMRKLLSAAGKFAGYRTAAGTGINIVSPPGLSGINHDGCQQHSLTGKAEEINRDIKESVEFGIAAAEVARRRKQNERKEAVEEDACKNDQIGCLAAAKKRRKKNSINITV